MKVLFVNGTEGEITDETGKNLYLRGRFSSRDWKALETEMLRLGIIGFEEPILKKYGAHLVDIQYVRNQIKSH